VSSSSFGVSPCNVTEPPSQGCLCFTSLSVYSNKPLQLARATKTWGLQQDGIQMPRA
jgi:hypothetical protein